MLQSLGCLEFEAILLALVLFGFGCFDIVRSFDAFDKGKGKLVLLRGVILVFLLAPASFMGGQVLYVLYCDVPPLTDEEVQGGAK